jgi:NitT/TauT family transport system substrate-binding protein
VAALASRRDALGCILSLLTLGWLGCSRRDPSSTAPTQNQTTVPAPPDTVRRETPLLKLTASRTPALCRIAWVVAQQKGYFTAEGLDVELLATRVDPHAAPDQDVPGGSWVNGPTGRFQTDLTVVEYANLPAMAAGSLDYYVVAGEHSGCRQLIVPVGSQIRALADLKGKRVGVSTAEHTSMFDYLFREAGLASRDVTWVRLPVTLGGDDQLASAKAEFAAGRLDAYVTADPVGEILKTDGLVRHLASNTWTSPLNGWYCCMIAVRREVLDAHPEVGRKVTRAIRRAASFVEENAAAAVELAIEAGQLPKDTRRDLSARLLTEYVWTATGRIQEDLERYFQLLIEDGKIAATTSAREFVGRVYRGTE